MNKLIWLGVCAGLISTGAHAVPGEYWEVSTKMEMAGMPFAMPAMTAKVCIPAGGEKNPQNMQKKDDKCQMTDVKTSGNKVTWKAKCVDHGETMNGTGESVHERDSYHGNMHLTGQSGGQPIDMTQTYNGKKIGGACDSEAQMKEITGKLCDSAKFTTSDWIARSEMFLKGNTCPGKKEPLCSAVRKDAVRDASAYQMLINTEKNNGALITTACGLNLEATRAAVCKANKDGSYGFLKANCPAEAKEYLEASRKKNCEGRGYTARSSMDACMSAKGGDDVEEPIAMEAASKNKGKQGKAGQEHADGKDAAGGPGSLNADTVLEGAKKLKGLFGF